MTFSEFKIALRNYEENEKNCKTKDQDNVMYTKPQKRFEGKCFKCDKKGHKSADYWLKNEKWCSNCKSKTHNTKDCRSKKDGKDAAKTANKPKKEDNDEHSFTFALRD